MPVQLFQMPDPVNPFQAMIGGMNDFSNLQQNQAKTQMFGAEAQKDMRQAQLPFGGVQLPGEAGQIAGLETIRQVYGDNSPQYQMAMNAFKLNQNRIQSMINYQQTNLPYKNLPENQKNVAAGQGMPLGIPGTFVNQPYAINAPTFGASNSPQMPPQLPMTPQQIQTLQQLNGSGAPQNNLNTPAMQKSAQMDANRKAAGAKISDRYQAAVAVDNLINTPEAQNAFNQLANNSGMMSQAKLQLQRITNPSAYLQYQTAANQFQKILGGSLKVMEGIPTTDAGMGQVNNYFKLANSTLYTDPAASANYIKRGLAVLDAEKKSLAASAQPIFPNVNQNVSTSALSSNFSPNATAQKVRRYNPATGRIE